MGGRSREARRLQEPLLLGGADGVREILYTSRCEDTYMNRVQHLRGLRFAP